ncbi:MAG TPA: fatty acid desaturase [Alphaproteobacteria bacterium]|nr:fatty acid desaturase [Alphaproteobacteria bacterium]
MFDRSAHPSIPRRHRAIEWPTWAVAASVYVGWGLVTWFHAALPLWLVLPAGAWLVAWHGSLQHETIHGHPTRLRWLNAALGWPPLGLWMPYELYRESHLAHHRNARVTCPIEDPESFYVLPGTWAAMAPATRALFAFNQTLAGRLTVGPGIVLARFLTAEAGRLRRGDRKRRLVWLRHAAGVGAVLTWVVGICGLPLWQYLSGFVYAGLALTLLRSFAEHRAAVDPGRRTAVVRAGPLLSLLFLNNNLHVTHHAKPSVPWYRLPAVSRTIDADRHAADGAGLYRGYRDVVRRFLFRTLAHPVHPFVPDRASAGDRRPEGEPDTAAPRVA